MTDLYMFKFYAIVLIIWYAAKLVRSLYRLI